MYSVHLKKINSLENTYTTRATGAGKQTTLHITTALQRIKKKKKGFWKFWICEKDRKRNLKLTKHDIL